MLKSFNSLYWDFCSASTAAGTTKRESQYVLSIPFIGIFALHLSADATLHGALVCPFNSLYWDFCSASSVLRIVGTALRLAFQFPLLGFLLCILFHRVYLGRSLQISFNSLYWDFCSASRTSAFFRKLPQRYLSIPFIGIFALHQNIKTRQDLLNKYHFQFPLLGFLLCIFINTFGTIPYTLFGLSIPFIGIFALHLGVV